MIPAILRFCGHPVGVDTVGTMHFLRTCPGCGSLNVRRSSVRVFDVSARHYFLSPYRCRDCRERFWVVSRRAFYLIGFLGVAAVAVVATLLLTSVPVTHIPEEATRSLDATK